jgi:all-trans-retinol dehydrogenase (NAD+)
MRLSQKTALVTGAARGIGRAITLRLAESCAHLVGVDRTLESLEETRALVEARGVRFTAVACDITSAAEVEVLRGRVENLEGGLHLLVNNAGVPASGPFGEMPFEVWTETIAINLTGALRVTHALLPCLRTNAPAHVVNVASIAGKFGTEGLAAYAAAKHGLVGFSSSLRCELADENIGVSWICPSFTRTRFLDRFQSNAFTPVIDPSAVADAVVRAVERNQSEVFVPGYQRFFSSVLPALLPTFSRTVSRRFRMGGNWLDLREGPGFRPPSDG